MKSKKIVFIKTVSLQVKPTEQFALEILNNPKYDDYPQYIDKDEIQKAFDEFGNKLNPFNGEIYSGGMSAPNVEGKFLAENIPEIDSLVIDEACDDKKVQDILDKDSDITHIGLSTYAEGLSNGINIIKMIKREFPDKILYLGGIGVLYPYYQNLIKTKNICFGHGVNWLREKFELRPFNFKEFRIPIIISNGGLFPTKAAYAVTQLGCPFNCDFCVSSNLPYNPFCDKHKIIEYFEKVLSQCDEDIFLYICDPNAFFPEKTWKSIFDYFIENRRKWDVNLYIIALTSLAHLSKFNLKKIQKECTLKLFLANYGIESTTGGYYEKNRGVTNEFIKNLNELGIITYHNFILGLPHHNKHNIDLEISRNMQYDSIVYSVNTLKPMPTTSIYKQLLENDQLFGEDLPPEFWYKDGFFPFRHKNLGKGFSALKYAFKGYFECEKKCIDVYSGFSEILSRSNYLDSSHLIRRFIRTFLKLSEFNLSLFRLRMPISLVNEYELRLQRCRKNMRSHSR